MEKVTQKGVYVAANTPTKAHASFHVLRLANWGVDYVLPGIVIDFYFEGVMFTYRDGD